MRLEILFLRQTGSEGPIAFSEELVIDFPSDLRESRVPAWRRLQAARAT